MIPKEKVQDIIAKHDSLEKDLSSSNINPKIFAQKSKEYSNLGNIISLARKFVMFDNEIPMITSFELAVPEPGAICTAEVPTAGSEYLVKS